MMPTVLAFDQKDVDGALDRALEIGQTIIFPTDTVYGIGGNPWDTRTLDRVRLLKERPADQPFTLHLPTIESIASFADVGPRRRRVVERFLPGPYTLLLPAISSSPPSAVLDGRIGIRVPDHPFFQGALARLGRPLFGTSVNRHGDPPLGDIIEIIDRFSAVDLIFTGPVGRQPSVILDLTEDTVRIVRGEVPENVRRFLDLTS